MVYAFLMGVRGNSRSGTASRYITSRLLGNEYTCGAIMHAVREDVLSVRQRAIERRDKAVKGKRRDAFEQNTCYCSLLCPFGTPVPLTPERKLRFFAHWDTRQQPASPRPSRIPW
jgi:hypothetical protein